MTRAPAHIYQRPTVDQATVMDMLDRVEHTHRNNATAAVAGGAVLCLVSVLLLTILYYLLAFGGIGDLGFKWTYVIVGLVSLPLLFLIAFKLQGSVLEATVPGSTLLESRIIGQQVVPLLVVGEMANVGPRLVLWGISQLRGRSAFGTMQHERLAAALLTLIEADGGVSPAKLLLPGESADALEPMLGSLLYFELADIGKKGDRVWVTTEAKKKLGLVA